MFCSLRYLTLTHPTNTPQMNYVCVILAAVAFFAVGYWYAAGRYYYTGPRVKAQLVEASLVGGQFVRVGDGDEKADEKSEGGS